MTHLTRRRALFIGAAAIAFGPRAAVAEAGWRGQALGAHAEIRILNLSPAEAAPILTEIEGELRRLEAIFSLYRPDSTLSCLNRDGVLDAPPPELLEVLTLARAVHAETGGLFDPTVQPLFRFHAEAAAGSRSVDPEEVGSAMEAIGLEHVRFDADEVRYRRPGAAMTLNGLAQGYITDRVAAILRGHGLGDVLVDLGEIAALGRGPGGRGWRVGIAGSDRVLTLSDAAVATSAPMGTVIDPERGVGHILHPRRGWIVPIWSQVSVVAGSAAEADALSTAAVLADAAALDTLRGPGREIFAIPA